MHKNADYTLSDNADELTSDVSIFKRIQDFEDKVNNNKVLQVLFRIDDGIMHILKSIRSLIHKIPHVEPMNLILRMITVLLLVSIFVFIMSNPSIVIDKIIRIFNTLNYKI